MSDMVVSKGHIEKIIEAGNEAPSGHNGQNWFFHVSGNHINIYLDPNDDLPIYDVAHEASYISHGAVIENMVIAADHFGYRADVALFPDAEDQFHTACITLHHDPVDRGVDLYRFIGQRVTDRNEYEPSALTEELIAILHYKMQASCDSVRVEFRTDSNSIRDAARSTAVHEALILSNKQLFEVLQETLRIGRQSVHGTRDGLDMMTLELPMFERIFFQLLARSWFLAKAAYFFGSAVLAYLTGVQKYKTSSCICGIVLPDTEPQSFLCAGRAMERLWLEATKRGVSVQPTFGVGFLLRSHELENRGNFSEREVSRMRTAVDCMKRIFTVAPEETLAMTLRLGHKKLHPHTSLRKPPQVTWR